MNIKESLSYNDLLVVPQYSDIRSRKEVSIASCMWRNMDRIKFHTPIISSPMDTITEEAMAAAMSKAKSLSIIHRYNSIKEQVDVVSKAVKLGADRRYMGAAIGTGEDGLARTRALLDAGISIICIDIAHGHHILMKETLSGLRKEFGKNIHIIAGNIATRKGYEDLVDWGADSVRAGIGGGCFVPNTVVNTVFGQRVIQDIKVGDLVYSHTGEPKVVTNTMVFEKDDEICSINNIECTLNHEFYVIKKTDKEFVTEDNIHEFAHWVAAEDLDKKIHLLIELE